MRALDELKIKLNETTAAVQQAGESLASFKNRLDRSKPGESVDALFEFYRGDQFRQQNAFEIDADRSAASLATALGISGTEGLDLGGIADAQEGGGATRREERARRSRIASRDRETRRMARSQSFLGRVTGGLGMERDDAGNLRPLDAMEQGTKGLVTTLGTLQSGFAEFFTNVASGAMSAGDAAVVMGAKMLTALGQVAIQEGTVMLFKAIPAAIEAPPLGAAYAIAGAGLIAVGAGLTAAGAAVTPPKPSAGASASADRNARAIGPRSSSTSLDGGGYGDTTVVMASLVPAGVVDATNARNGLRRVRRAGMDDQQRIARRVEF